MVFITKKEEEVRYNQVWVKKKKFSFYLEEKQRKESSIALK